MSEPWKIEGKPENHDLTIIKTSQSIYKDIGVCPCGWSAWGSTDAQIEALYEQHIQADPTQ